MDLFAVGTSIKLPVTGVYIGANSEKAIDALLSIASKRPKMLEAMEKVADSFDGIEVAKFAVGMGVAFQVDMQRLAPDSMAAQVTGVTKVIIEHFTEDNGENNPNVTSVKEPAHAVRFQPQG